jgi:hypothetical protein
MYSKYLSLLINRGPKIFIDDDDDGEDDADDDDDDD